MKKTTKLKELKCEHQFLFNIMLGIDYCHIAPHPSKKEEKLIIKLLEEIIKKLKN